MTDDVAGIVKRLREIARYADYQDHAMANAADLIERLSVQLAEERKHAEAMQSAAKAALDAVTRERDNLIGVNAAWKRDYAGEKERGDKWMADCKRAEAALAEAEKDARRLDWLLDDYRLVDLYHAIGVIDPEDKAKCRAAIDEAMR